MNLDREDAAPHGPKLPEERISFGRDACLPGVEVLSAENTDRCWRWLNTAFSIALPTTWAGEAGYRGRLLPVEPGIAFCSAPGEIHTTPKVHQRGTFRALIFDIDLFQGLMAKLGSRGGEVTWGAIAEPVSVGLRTRALWLAQNLGTETEALAQQSVLAELFVEMGESLLETSVSRRQPDVAPGAAARVREALHHGPDTMDLNALAERTGLNRFQVLRCFKRAYGVTPHAYQICRRIGRARELLKRGETPADVALDCGFADQSHFGRHFRKLVGVTPGRYKRDPRETSAEALGAILGQADR